MTTNEDLLRANVAGLKKAVELGMANAAKLQAEVDRFNRKVNTLIREAEREGRAVGRRYVPWLWWAVMWG